MITDDLLKPAAAAQRLDMPPSTLRVYSTRFAELLSQSASNPPLSADGKPGHRLYTARDIVILAKAKELLGQGVTYEQALEELRSAGLGVRTRSRSQSVPVPEPMPSAGVSAPPLDALAKAVEGWQELAEERAKENALLRQRITVLEKDREQELAMLMDRLQQLEQRQRDDPRKSGWLARVFGR